MPDNAQKYRPVYFIRMEFQSYLYPSVTQQNPFKHLLEEMDWQQDPFP